MKHLTESMHTEDLEKDLDDGLCSSRSSTVHSEVEVDEVSDNAVSALGHQKAEASFQGSMIKNADLKARILGQFIHQNRETT